MVAIFKKQSEDKKQSTSTTVQKTDNVPKQSPGMLAGALQEMIDQKLVKSMIHPVMDVLTNDAMGYEFLARGSKDLAQPTDMFRTALALNKAFELDVTCLESAMARILTLDENTKRKNLFLNVYAPNVESGRFESWLCRQSMHSLGINPEMLVIELTNCGDVKDMNRLATACARIKHIGYNLSIDDVGAGVVGMSHINAARPTFIKISPFITRHIHEGDYVQMIIRNLQSFANAVHATLIVEGVETVEQAEILLRHDVRYMQGFLFHELSTNTENHSEILTNELAPVVKKYLAQDADHSGVIQQLAVHRHTIQVDKVLIKELHETYQKQADLDHIVILDAGKPVGMTTRNGLAKKLSGKYGFALYEKRPAKLACQPNGLIIPYNTSVQALAKLAMARSREQLYDPVMVTDQDGDFLGTITMRQLIKRSTELEVEAAQDANPLTGLPGNRMIHRWITHTLDAHEGAVVYIDLDRFKEYNDAFGFLRGDECIRYCAEVLRSSVFLFEGSVRIGHVGGDDFVMVLEKCPPAENLMEICQRFDNNRDQLFPKEVLETGHFKAKDRAGNMVESPLTTVSIAAICVNALGKSPHFGHLSKVSAELKKKAKAQSARTGASGYMLDQRDYQADELIGERGPGAANAIQDDFKPY